MKKTSLTFSLSIENNLKLVIREFYPVNNRNFIRLLNHQLLYALAKLAGIVYIYSCSQYLIGAAVIFLNIPLGRDVVQQDCTVSLVRVTKLFFHKNANVCFLLWNEWD